jgi:hypothetical protein
MNLDRVTITGADDSVTADQLLEISQRFPFVEWGILYSRSWLGSPRYPSTTWCIANLAPLSLGGARLSAHLCGHWVRRLVLDASFDWCRHFAGTQHVFDRIQLNFHGRFHEQHPKFASLLKSDGRQFILQCDGINDRSVLDAHIHRGVGVPLFDRSGGVGELPTFWPEAWPGVYCGYAGGLGPLNVAEQLTRIASVAGAERIWIDMESRVRSADNARLDLGAVVSVLEQVTPYVTATPIAAGAAAPTQGDSK